MGLDAIMHTEMFMWNVLQKKLKLFSETTEAFSYLTYSSVKNSQIYPKSTPESCPNLSSNMSYVQT